MAPTIEFAVQDFLLSCRQSLRPSTTGWYAFHLRGLIERLEGTPIDQVQPLIIRQQLVEIREQKQHRKGGNMAPGPVSKETIRARQRAYKRFFNWCVQEYDLNPLSNPMRKIKMLGADAQMPKAVDMDDVKKLLAACEDNPCGKRNRAIIFFLLDTGCRAGGLLTLTTDRLQVEIGRAIITEKGDRSRVVPFTAPTALALSEWLAVRPAQASTVFCTLGWTEKRHATQLTNQGLREIFRRLAAKAGVEGRYNPHAFRHGNAREFLTNGGNIAALQQLLGHSNSNVTMMFYARWNVAELAEQQKKYSPVHNLED